MTAVSLIASESSLHLEQLGYRFKVKNINLCPINKVWEEALYSEAN